MTPYCYEAMFENCLGLTSIPSGLLPATTLAESCYQSMFRNCTGLTSLPSGFRLPATTLATKCYANMFQGCSLTTLPDGFTLLAPKMAEGCYNQMFYACSSLTTLPDGLLPATTLALRCYNQMFAGTGLTKAPYLPANKGVWECYREMFFGCSSLNEVSCNLTTNMLYTSTYCTYNWLSGVAATGTFYANPSALAGATTTDPTNTTWHINSVNGIPTGWTVTNL